ncbi:MAG: hypothetical protein ACR2NJ_01530 [Acidimicrobiales bacterium]
MAVAGGILIGLAIIWAFLAFFFRWIQDVPLGPVNTSAGDEAHRENERGAVEAQRRLAKFWRTRLWPIALCCVLAAVVLLALAAT